MLALNHAVHPASHRRPRDKSAPDASDLNKFTVLNSVGMEGRLLSIAV